jgi:hypothetical protein
MLLLWKLSTQNYSLVFVVTPYSHLQNIEKYYFFNDFFKLFLKMYTALLLLS